MKLKNSCLQVKETLKKLNQEVRESAQTNSHKKGRYNRGKNTSGNRERKKRGKICKAPTAVKRARVGPNPEKEGLTGRPLGEKGDLPDRKVGKKDLSASGIGIHTSRF